MVYLLNLNLARIGDSSREISSRKQTFMTMYKICPGTIVLVAARKYKPSGNLVQVACLFHRHFWLAFVIRYPCERLDNVQVSRKHTDFQTNSNFQQNQPYFFKYSLKYASYSDILCATEPEA